MKVARTKYLVRMRIEKSPGRSAARRTDSSPRAAFQEVAFEASKPAIDSLSQSAGSSARKQAVPQVTVFRFSEKSELARARALIDDFYRRTDRLYAIASPVVYNAPEFRSVLEEGRVKVFVGEPEKVNNTEIEQWISAGAIHEREQSAAAPARASAGEGKREWSPDEMGASERLRDPATGRLDARLIAHLLGISLTDLATRVCGVTKQAIGQNPTSSGIQRRLEPLEEIAQALIWFGGDEAKLRAWLRRPNSDFALLRGKAPSPLDLILAGHSAVVMRKVRNLLAGHPA